MSEKYEITSNQMAHELAFGKDRMISTGKDYLYLRVLKTQKYWRYIRSYQGEMCRAEFKYLSIKDKPKLKDEVTYSMAKILADEFFDDFKKKKANPDSVSLQWLFEDYLVNGGNNKNGDNRPSTTKDYINSWNMLSQWFRDLDSIQLSAENIEKLMNELSKKHLKNEAGLFHPRIKQLMKNVWGINTHARKRYAVPVFDPKHSINKKYTFFYKYEKEKALKKEQTEAVLKFLLDAYRKEPSNVRTESDYKISYARHSAVSVLIVLLLTGTRMSEMRELQWKEVAMKNGNNWGYLELPSSRTKTRKDYVIGFGKRTRMILDMFWKKSTDGTGDVFISKAKMAVSYNTLRRYYKILKEEFGYDVKSRTMRTTFSTIAYSSGIDKDAIRLQMSHSSGNTILDRNYLEHYIEDRVASIQKYEDYLFENIENDFA